MFLNNIYKKEIIFENNCWKKCGNGFCCDNQYKNFDFSLINTSGSTILYTPREYEFAINFKKTHENIFYTKPKFIKKKVNDIEISVIMVKCNLLGKCNNIIDKPILCRLYPFIPVFDFTSTLIDMVPASIYDMVFKIKEFDSVCKINDFKKYFKYYQDNDLKFDTYTKFYFYVVYLYYKTIKKNLISLTKNLKVDNKSFWKKFEFLLLTGKLFEDNNLDKKIYDCYLNFKIFDKSFTLDGESNLIKNLCEKNVL